MRLDIVFETGHTWEENKKNYLVVLHIFFLFNFYVFFFFLQAWGDLKILL
jgi:hypothetical protein